MDAGSGSGNLTRILADKVKHGEIYAVDTDPNMVQQAKSNLSGWKNVQVIHSSMNKVNLPMEVDVIFLTQLSIRFSIKRISSLISGNC